jgi:hypothetical protein
LASRGKKKQIRKIERKIEEIKPQTTKETLWYFAEALKKINSLAKEEFEKECLETKEEENGES